MIKMNFDIIQMNSILFQDIYNLSSYLKIIIIEMTNRTCCVSSLKWNVFSRATNFHIICKNSNFPNVISSIFKFELLIYC